MKGWNILLIIAIGSVLSPGCMSVRLGAPHSLNPVMLGPKKYIGQGTPKTARTRERRRGTTNFRASSRLFSSSDGNSSSSQSSSTIENAMDITVVSASNGNVFDMFEVNEINCNGWGAYWGIFIGAGNKCTADAQRIQRRPASRR